MDQKCAHYRPLTDEVTPEVIKIAQGIFQKKNTDIPVKDKVGLWDSLNNISCFEWLLQKLGLGIILENTIHNYNYSCGHLSEFKFKSTSLKNGLSQTSAVILNNKERMFPIMKRQRQTD